MDICKEWAKSIPLEHTQSPRDQRPLWGCSGNDPINERELTTETIDEMIRMQTHLAFNLRGLAFYNTVQADGGGMDDHRLLAFSLLASNSLCG